jgi:hypothetical protein
MRRPTTERVRGRYLGGHDASAILGLNPYASAADVYAKVVAGWQPAQTPRMLRGLLVEPGMVEFIRERRQLAVLDRDCFYVDDRIPFFAGSIDAVESPWVIHEVKSTLAHGWGAELSTRWGPDNSDDVERSAWLQCQWYMGLTGAREAHVWLLILDDDEEPRHYTVPRNRVAIEELRDAAEAFWWDHVACRVPPAVACISDKAAAALAPKGVRDSRIEPTPEIVVAANAFAVARLAEKMAGATKDQAGAVLKSFLGSAEKVKWEGGSISYRESRLKPSTNWEQVAHELAIKHGISGEVFTGIVKEQTHEGYTARVLRVTVNNQQEGDKK